MGENNTNPQIIKNLLVDYSNITTNLLEGELMLKKKVSLSVIRLDKIHSIISGNKLFKLNYFLEKINEQPIKKIISFGGAYSNHLVATAFACNQKNIDCIGIVRGEKPALLSQTLIQCSTYGMQLVFISRAEYEKKDEPDFIENLKTQFGDCLIIPEGGYHYLGAKGAAEIMDFINSDSTHICCATGTATTIAGLLMKATAHQKLIAFPVLKGMTDIENRISFLTNNQANLDQLHIENNYHFGGYAKKTPALIAFMNQLYQQYQLPTDFVYTAKMMFGVFDLIENDFFKPGSKITCIHTGGLQGNVSLPTNSLTF